MTRTRTGKNRREMKPRQERPLYKYLKKAHLEDFLQFGTIRMGTLYEYRDIESHGKVIGDSEEGVQTTELSLPGDEEIDLASSSSEADFLRKPGITIPSVIEISDGSILDLTKPSPEAEAYNRMFKQLSAQPVDWGKIKVVLDKDSRIIQHTNSPDLYIYCLSGEYSESVMNEFGYDSCIEIVRPREFLKAISRCFYHEGRYQGLVQIRYANRSTHYLSPHKSHPATTKDPLYKDQDEWRAIWAPTQKINTPYRAQDGWKHETILPQIKPQILNVPKAIPCCRAHTS
jgi:hypothetical protein